MIVAVEDITPQQQRRTAVAAIEEDRQRIAREIHDGVAQDLAFLRLKLALWQEWVEADPARMQAELTHTQAVLDKAIEEIRRSIYALRPLALDTQGLLPALRRYAADFSEQHDIFVTLAIDVADDQLPATLELLLFRVIQEALNNVAQHARASLAWVELRAADEAVTLLIRDNGQGFDARDRRAAGRTRGLGLMQMRERVAAAGGRLDVDSRPGQGTAIQAWLPLP